MKSPKDSKLYCRIAMLALGLCRCASLCAVTVYDGSQKGNVRHLDAPKGNDAVLSLRTASPKSENPTFVVLAEYGPYESNNCIRISFNGRRERRVCGCYGGVRVFSPPGVLDDGKLHHVALSVSPGREMELFIDGKKASSEKIPDNGFPAGYLAIAQRVHTLDPIEEAGWRKYWSTLHFRGVIDDVRLVEGKFSPCCVDGGVQAKSIDYGIPPDRHDKVPTWERPKTTRRYLHGPFSERMYTYWREGKIVFGEVVHNSAWSIHPNELEDHAVWLVHGENDDSFDFRTARLSVTDDGIPEHCQTWTAGALEVSLSAVVPFGRRPSGHVRLSVRNSGYKKITHPFAVLVRAGKEMKLVYGAPDVYDIYNPDVSTWLAMPPTNLVFKANEVRCGERFVAVHGDGFSWDAKNGALRFDVELEPGASRSVELEIGKGASDGLRYDEAAQSMRSSWNGELAKLDMANLPKDAETLRLTKNFAVQMLQCLAMPTQGDFVLPRQGGLQRFVWPWDAAAFLAGLDLIGYGGYVKKALDFYFGQCQRDSGEFGPFRHKWACDTACVLESFANHCLVSKDADCWRKYRDQAMCAFGWIERMRSSGGGLFPSMVSTDAGVASRHWVMTDARNVIAYGKFVKAAELFADRDLAALKTAEKGYRAEMKKVLDVWREAYRGKDELRIPSTSDGSDDDGLERFRYPDPGAIADAGFLTQEELLRVRRWLLRRGFAHERGMYKNIAARDPACRHHVWYTTSAELGWMRAWLRVGRRDMARKALESSMLTAITDEYYVGERYHDANPWFYPWSPNASGMGRILMMISQMNKCR